MFFLLLRSISSGFPATSVNQGYKNPVLPYNLSFSASRACTSHSELYCHWSFVIFLAFSFTSVAAKWTYYRYGEIMTKLMVYNLTFLLLLNTRRDSMKYLVCETFALGRALETGEFFSHRLVHESSADSIRDSHLYHLVENFWWFRISSTTDIVCAPIFTWVYRVSFISWDITTVSLRSYVDLPSCLQHLSLWLWPLAQEWYS